MIRKDQRSRDLYQKWMKLVNKLNESEKLPRNFGIESPLYPSEIHTIQVIGDFPDSNVRTVALNLGITPGAASQQISRLAKRGLIRKVRGKKNEKEVHLELTDLGRVAYDTHNIRHEVAYTRIVSRIGLISDEEAAFLERVLNAVKSVYDERIDEIRTGIDLSPSPGKTGISPEES